jgi:hypothetical protein
MGCFDVNYLVITTRRADQSNNSFLFANTLSGGVSFADADSLGLYVANRINNQANGFKNGISKGSNTVADNARNNREIVIGAQSSLGFNISQYTSRQSAFATIGDGLTDTEATNFYTAVQAYQTTLGRHVGVPIVADTDAQAFLNAAVITNTTQASAINTLVTDLKTANIWTKMKALYPFIGGTAEQHRWNLKNTAQYKIDWFGGGTHGPNGYQPNGNSYGNTNLVGTSVLSLNSTHISTYLITNSTGTYADIGVIQGGGTSYLQLLPKWSDNIFYGQINDANFSDNTVADSLGLFIGNRQSSTGVKLIKNSTVVTSKTSNSVALPSVPIYLGARNNGNVSVQNYSNRGQAFASIGDGLTDAEATAFYNAVQAYQVALGRQV